MASGRRRGPRQERERRSTRPSSRSRSPHLAYDGVIALRDQFIKWEDYLLRRKKERGRGESLNIALRPFPQQDDAPCGLVCLTRGSKDAPWTFPRARHQGERFSVRSMESCWTTPTGIPVGDLTQDVTWEHFADRAGNTLYRIAVCPTSAREPSTCRECIWDPQSRRTSRGCGTCWARIDRVLTTNFGLTPEDLLLLVKALGHLQSIEIGRPPRINNLTDLSVFWNNRRLPLVRRRTGHKQAATRPEIRDGLRLS